MVKGGGTPLVLPLTICDLAAISRPAAPAPWLPDASCSCTSCSPTEFRLHLAEKRRSELLTELLHRRIDRLAGLSGNAGREVVLCFLFQQSQDNRLPAIALSNHCIAFPVANLQPGRCNLGPLIYGCSVYNTGSHYGFLFLRCQTSFYNRPCQGGSDCAEKYLRFLGQHRTIRQEDG